MRKVLSLFLSLLLAFTPCVSLACEHGHVPSPVPPSITSEDVVPSITVDDLYRVSGAADIYRNSKFDYLSMIRPFADDIVDCIPLFLYPTEDSRHIYFTLIYPVAEMDYDCYLINADCELVGNVTSNYLVCSCGEEWYDINVVLAPNKYEQDEVIYLVWVK